jgi:hypothetical protein
MRICDICKKQVQSGSNYRILVVETESEIEAIVLEDIDLCTGCQEGLQHRLNVILGREEAKR